MSGYCTHTPPAALYGDTNLASSIPRIAISDGPVTKRERRRILARLREQLPDPSLPYAERQSSGDSSKNATRKMARRPPIPSTGPVFLEGRLVLSLSFHLNAPTGNQVPVPEGEPLLERWRIWDDMSHDWLPDGLTLLRFESADVVMRIHPQPAIAWSGALDVRQTIIAVPDMDSVGLAINRRHHLRWKQIWPVFPGEQAQSGTKSSEDFVPLSIRRASSTSRGIPPQAP